MTFNKKKNWGDLNESVAADWCFVCCIVGICRNELNNKVLHLLKTWQDGHQSTVFLIVLYTFTNHSGSQRTRQSSFSKPYKKCTFGKWMSEFTEHSLTNLQAFRSMNDHIYFYTSLLQLLHVMKSNLNSSFF